MPTPSGSYFAHSADIYAPDEAALLPDGRMLRTTTDIQRLDPGSNVPAPRPAFNPLIAAAGLVAVLALVHHFGGRKR